MRVRVHIRVAPYKDTCAHAHTHTRMKKSCAWCARTYVCACYVVSSAALHLYARVHPYTYACITHECRYRDVAMVYVWHHVHRITCEYRSADVKTSLSGFMLTHISVERKYAWYDLYVPALGNKFVVTLLFFLLPKDFVVIFFFTKVQKKSARFARSYTYICIHLLLYTCTYMCAAMCSGKVNRPQ